MEQVCPAFDSSAALRTSIGAANGSSNEVSACTCLRLRELEGKLAKFHGRDDAILYAACFDANAGIFEVASFANSNGITR